MNIVRVKTVVQNFTIKSDGLAHPFIGLENLESGTGRLLVDPIPCKAAEDSLVHQRGDVLFSKLRPYLAKSYLPQTSGTATGELLVLRPKKLISTRFLMYLTLSGPWVEWANISAYGTKMPRTSWELMGEFRFALPSLEMQERITEFLDGEIEKIDAISQARKRQGVLLGRHRAVALSGLFARASSSVPTRLKYLMRNKPRYGVLVPEFTNDGVPFVRINDLLDLRGRAVSLVRIPEALSQQHARTRVQPNDILLSVVGTLGRAALAPVELEGANIARAVASLRVRHDVDPGLFVRWIETADFMRQALDATGNDTAQPTLGMEDLGNFKLRWPTKAREQRRLAQEVEEVAKHHDELAACYEKQTRLLAERRRALITAAVTGQIDVTTARGVRVP